MKSLDHAFHILDKNRQILIPVFFHVIIIQLILSYITEIVSIQPDPQFIAQNFEILLSKFLLLGAISGLLVLITDSFFTSMSLSMIFEAWKKGKTTLNWSYGTKFFSKIFAARLLYIFLIIPFTIPFFLLSITQSQSVLTFLLSGASLVFLMAFVFFFFWINESIVTKKQGPRSCFSYSSRTTFRNFLLTLNTMFFIFAFYFISSALINIFSFPEQLILTTAAALFIAVVLKALVSTIKLVFFLQAE